MSVSTVNPNPDLTSDQYGAIGSFCENRKAVLVIGAVALTAIASVTFSCLLFIPGAPLSFAGLHAVRLVARKLDTSLLSATLFCSVGCTAAPTLFTAVIALSCKSAKMDRDEVLNPKLTPNEHPIPEDSPKPPPSVEAKNRVKRQPSTEVFSLPHPKNWIRIGPRGERECPYEYH